MPDGCSVYWRSSMTLSAGAAAAALAKRRAASCAWRSRCIARARSLQSTAGVFET